MAGVQDRSTGPWAQLPVRPEPVLREIEGPVLRLSKGEIEGERTAVIAGEDAVQEGPGQGVPFALGEIEGPVLRLSKGEIEGERTAVIAGEAAMLRRLALDGADYEVR